MMQVSLYQNIFHIDYKHPNKTWTKHRHTITYALAKLLPLLKTKTYFDIGANIGIHAWLCNQFDIDVYCFEPNSALNKYIQLNSKPKQLFNIAVGDYNGTGYYTKKIDSTGNHITKNENANSMTINIKKLDDIILPPPGIIKFDVEGHETSAIKGASTTIVKFYPWIIVEDKFNKENIDKTLIELNYTKHSQWRKDSIWHHNYNQIPIDTITVPSIAKDLRKLSPKDWQW